MGKLRDWAAKGEKWLGRWGLADWIRDDLWPTVWGGLENWGPRILTAVIAVAAGVAGWLASQNPLVVFFAALAGLAFAVYLIFEVERRMVGDQVAEPPTTPTIPQSTIIAPPKRSVKPDVEADEPRLPDFWVNKPYHKDGRFWLRVANNGNGPGRYTASITIVEESSWLPLLRGDTVDGIWKNTGTHETDIQAGRFDDLFLMEKEIRGAAMQLRFAYFDPSNNEQKEVMSSTYIAGTEDQGVIKPWAKINVMISCDPPSLRGFAREEDFTLRLEGINRGTTQFRR